MCWLLRAWFLYTLAGSVFGQHRIEQDTILATRPAKVRDRSQTDLAKQDEPSCEQLKAIWRFSKRQARAPEIVNEVSNYRDPMMYNEWPVYSTLPQAAPRYRSQYRGGSGRETFGRVVTKAPPNVVRTPDYAEMFGMLQIPHASGKILRFPGPSRSRSGMPVFAVPPQRHKFDDVRKMIQGERIRELQRQYEAEQKHELRQMVASGKSIDDYAFGNAGEHEPRGLQVLASETYPEDGAGRHPKKPLTGSRQVNQFSRYSDVMLPPSRRSFYPPLFPYAPIEYVPYAA